MSNLCESYLHKLSKTPVAVKNYPGANFRKDNLPDMDKYQTAGIFNFAMNLPKA